MILPAIITYLAVLAWDLWSDYRKWLRSRTVNHKKEAILRMILLIPSGILFMWDQPWFFIFAVVPLMGFWWLLLFNGIYNRLRGFGWWFAGSVDPDDSWIDRWIYSGSNTAQVIIIPGVFVSTVTYIALCLRF